MGSNRRRDRRVSLWLSEEELGTIRSSARLAGLSVTEFVVGRCVRNATTFSPRSLPGAPAGAVAQEDRCQERAHLPAMHRRGEGGDSREGRGGAGIRLRPHDRVGARQGGEQLMAAAGL